MNLYLWFLAYSLLARLLQTCANLPKLFANVVIFINIFTSTSEMKTIYFQHGTFERNHMIFIDATRSMDQLQPTWPPCVKLNYFVDWHFFSQVVSFPFINLFNVYTTNPTTVICKILIILEYWIEFEESFIYDKKDILLFIIQWCQ